MYRLYKGDTMTPEQALQIATEAHEGQFRRPRELTNAEVEAIPVVLDFTENHTQYLDNGSKLVYIDSDVLIQKPYISHPIAVANMLDTDEEKVIAYLHDVVEDTDYKLHPSLTAKYAGGHPGFWLGEHRITGTVWKALHYLTKKKGQKYTDYVKALSGSKLYTKIKIADITCNLLDNPSDKQVKKYTKAMKILLEVI